MARGRSQSTKNNDNFPDELVTRIADHIFQRLDDRLAKMDDKLGSFMNQVNNNSEAIRTIENKVDKNEQYDRLNNLRIYGIKESPGENQEVLLKTVTSLLKNKLNITVTKEDFDRCHRVGVSGTGMAGDRPVLVRFVSFLVRSEVYQNKRLLKKTGFVIREDLTGNRIKLVKEAINKYGVTNVWTVNGKVFILKNNNKVCVAGSDDI
ncbi:uncharacterized protein LOC115883031 [Sitophilus oryzae]|uniref:Uncharacterized protein LOC115883031 n=1 Tax=Sitophilus oryzae TaxID=7048 RepID=A0A6J2Y0C6_SITOR|nr:uncharacterized protein LOC115883031 [Sitophilus oryzae]